MHRRDRSQLGVEGPRRLYSDTLMPEYGARKRTHGSWAIRATTASYLTLMGDTASYRLRRLRKVVAALEKQFIAQRVVMTLLKNFDRAFPRWRCESTNALCLIWPAPMSE